MEQRQQQKDILGGIPSPSPTYPQQINNVEGTIQIKKCNKNILKLDTLQNDNYSLTTYAKIGNIAELKCGYEIQRKLSIGENYINQEVKSEYDPIVTVKFKDLKPNTKYTISCDVYSNISNKEIYIFGIRYANTPTKAITSFTTNADGEKTLTHCYFANRVVGEYLNCLNILLVEGEYTAQTIPEYIPPKEKTYNFPLSTGQKLMQDGTIEGKVNNEWAEIEFDGSEDEDWHYSSLSNNRNNFYINIPNAVKDYTQKIYNSVGIFRGSYTLDINYQSYISQSGNLNYLCNEYTNLTDFKAKLAELKQAGTPMIVQYKLETPDETEFTNDQQKVIDEIIKDGTYKEVTHYTAEASINPDIDMTYYRDLPTIINNLEN